MHPPLPDTLPMQLLHHFFRFRHTHWLKIPAGELTRTETGILIGIERATQEQKPFRISDLSKMMHVSPPTITQHIDNLESRGFVSRTQSRADKRAVNLTLTERGQETLRQHRQEIESTFKALVDHLGQEDAKTFCTLLSKTAEFFEDKQNLYNENSGIIHERGSSPC